MTQASCQTTINAPADTIWRLVSDFGTAEQYLDRVVNCTLEGSGVGAQRMLTSVDGSTILEQLETLDDAAHRLSYILLTNTPFRNCLTTMTVRDLGPSRAELTWSATFQTDGIPTSEAVELMEGALAVNCLALKQFLEH